VSVIDRIGIRRVAVERTTVISEQSFETVLARLMAAVGHPDMSAFAQDVAVARASADLERIVNAAKAPLGKWAMRAPRNSAASTAAYLAIRRSAISNACG
jgi:hypothetical protein